MKLISILFLLPFLFLIGCGGSSETIIIVDDPPIQTYSIEVVDLQAVVTFPATDYSVEISNVYSSDVITAPGDFATITDENDDVPMTFTFFDDFGDEITFFDDIVLSDYADFDTIVLDDSAGNYIEFTYSSIVILKK